MGKKTSVVVVALAVVASLAPLGAAHLTANSLWVVGGTVAYDGTFDQCRAEGSPQADDCTDNMGMSGTYRGTAGVHVSSSEFPLNVEPTGTVNLALVCVGRSTYDDPSSGPTASNRFCEIGTPSGCDLEFFLGPGSELNEDTVENDGPNGDGTALEGGTPGAIPDGMFDDGGDFGAVCHTDNGPDAWDTYGCGGSDGLGTAGEAFAEDAVLRGEVWISNECDFLTPIVVDDGEGNEWFDCTINQGVLGEDDSVFDIIATAPEGLPGSAEGWYMHMTGSALGTIPDLDFNDGGCDDMIVEAFVPTVTAPCTPDADLAVSDCDEFVTGVVEDLLALPGELIADLGEPIDDSPVIPVAACGPDAGPDVAHYGYGMGSEAGAGTGVANVPIGSATDDNAVTVDCSTDVTNGLQWGFVRDYVNVDLDGGQATDVRVGVTSGWYDVRN